MKKSVRQKAFSLLLISLFFLLSWSITNAQNTNLLSNPGFENPYVGVGGEPPRQVAQGWSPWHVARTGDMPSFQNTQPEYSPTAPDTSRIRSGNNAQAYSSFFATHDGGVFQRVTGITSGTELRFSVYAYVWSTTFDDRGISEEDGDVVLRVGIDPTGGTDGTSSNIVWSTPVEQYDAYREYSVIAIASGSAVTVFVRSTVGFPVQHSNIYLDDAVLAPTTISGPATNTAVAAAPTNTSAPPTAVPSATSTSVPQTNTAQPTDTSTAEPTDTSAPPTATLTPSVTNTPGEATPTREGVVPTATPFTGPTSTSTPGAIGGPTTPISDEFPGTVIHTVRSGDTVGQLAVQYNSSSQAIIQANGLGEEALIYVGQSLVIPVRTTNIATQQPTPFPTFTRTAPNVTASPIAQPTQGAGGGTGGVNIVNLYIVQRGDVLSRIASRFNTTVDALASLNGIVNPDRITPGQSILVPGPVPLGGPTGNVVPTSPPPVVVAPPATPTRPPVVVAPPAQPTYVVQPGDNLFRISLRFGVPLTRLAAVNNIVNYNLIYIGQVLVIP